MGAAHFSHANKKSGALGSDTIQLDALTVLFKHKMLAWSSRRRLAFAFTSKHFAKI